MRLALLTQEQVVKRLKMILQVQTALRTLTRRLAGLRAMTMTMTMTMTAAQSQ
jgi:hypothetical protein